MIFRHLAILAISFLVALLGTHAVAQTIATIGGKAITLEEFKKKYSEVRRQTINPPEPSVFLEDLIRFEVGVQEANKKKLEKDPIVKERFRQELYKALIEQELGDQVNAIKVSEAEMKSYYKENPEIRTSHILIEFKPGASEDEKASAKNRALEILKEVKGSKRDFAELVKLYTDDVISKNTGGDVGFQTRVTLVPTYYDAISKAKVGEVVGPILTQYGYHIVKVTGRRTYDQVTDKRPIRAGVFDQKRALVFNKYFSKLKANYKINVNGGALRGLKFE